MSMPFYVAPEQVMKDRADYARKGIARGSEVSTPVTSTPGPSAAARMLAREVNRQIERVATRFDSTEGDFLCECGRGDCAARVRLELADFDAVRQAGRFVTVPGH
ncbi:MAG: hypothetical protein ACLGHT_11925, partial [Acidimicrobiia bacterium]